MLRLAVGISAAWAGLAAILGSPATAAEGRKPWTQQVKNYAAMTVRWPGRVPAGRTSNFIWDMRDPFPTACDLAGAKPPEHLDGISVVPTLLGGKQKRNKGDMP